MIGVEAPEGRLRDGPPRPSVGHPRFAGSSTLFRMQESKVQRISETARLETFADGVMAIAITLLILEIEVPHLEAGESLSTALAAQWPSYAAYVVSFLTIGIIWVNHHHLFAVVERTNHTFLMLNVLFLMTIAALPWPTALIGEYIMSEAERGT